MRGRSAIEYAVYALADRLNRTVAEIRRMTVEEFNGWQAYLMVSEEKRKEES